ncbi:hypothetical protein PUN28_007889 [Cardiocondyla obscurior]|uniref:Uncharacterized protein n=1 Tax=Cardiocondyla obscurior TaxID=286306 RepID=A0AAW2G089_9HYME
MRKTRRLKVVSRRVLPRRNASCREFPCCRLAVNGNTVLHLSGPRGPVVQTRGPQAAPRRGGGATKKASPTMLVDTASKSRNSCRSLRSEFLPMRALIYHEGNERQAEAIQGRSRSRKRKRHRSTDWPRRFEVGFYERSRTARNKPAGGGPMEGAKQNGLEETKSG